MLLAGVLVAGVCAASASAAGARTTRVAMRATCTSVKFTFSGFPNAPNNTVTEVVNINGEKFRTEKFVFNGPTGSNTVHLGLAPGHYTLKTTAMWNTNGVQGESATKKTELECNTEPKTKKVEQEVTCTSVTFTFNGFPNAPNNTVHEVINVNGSKYKTETFVFNGPTGSNTVLLNLPPGHYTIKTTVNWNTNGVRGESATQKTELHCNVEPTPAFTIEKLQEIAGSEAGFTQAELTGEDGQTVDYEIVVKNTGNVTLNFKPLSDANCEGISPSTEETVAEGGEQTYTCHHELTGAGSYANTATIEGSEGTGAKTSNEVVVKIL